MWLAGDSPDMADVLAKDVIEANLPEEWTLDGQEIVRTYEFDDYLKGVAFASEIGEIAEEEFHHPEIRIRYEEVEVRFTSHEAGGVTEEDIRLAELCDDIR